MKALLRSGVATLAATVGAGMVVVGVGASASPGDDDAYGKREDNAKEWIVSADDDDDDDNTNTGVSNGTQHSAESTGRSGDATGSRYTKVSRDRDLSRGDKSRDFTGDGPGTRTRDFSANMTNDRSKNDTR